jgi:PhnB protein
MAFRPYLFFGGNCREAFTRYQEIFGGELMVMTMKDVPGEEPPPGMEDVVIHAAVTIGEDDYLMGSDEPGAESFGPVQGMMVTYDATDVADATRVLDALSDGGTVTQELIATFFSEGFGMCTDRFGTPWMVVAPEPAAAAS